MLGFGRRRGSRGRGFLNLPQETGFSRLPGEGEMGIFNAAQGDMSTRGGGKFYASYSGGRSISTLGPTGGPMTTSRADYGHVLEARRQAKLASTDPGLSTRGRVNAPGRGSRGPVRGGLETRGVRPEPGSRSAGRPIKTRSQGNRGLGLETRGTRPAAGTRSAAYDIRTRKPVDPSKYKPPKHLNLSMDINTRKPVMNATGGPKIGSYLDGVSYDIGTRKPIFNAKPPDARTIVLASKEQMAANRAKRFQEATARMKAQTDGRIQNLPKGRTPIAPAPGSPLKGGDNATGIFRKAIKYAKEMPTGRKALLAGAGAIGLGVLLGNRRERGTSSGAQQGRYGY